MFLIIRLLANVVGLWVARAIVAGFGVIGGVQGYLIAGIILTILNLVLKPILQVLSFPVIVLTLGLFLLVLNAIILWLTAQLTGYITLDGSLALLGATIIVSLVNFVIHKFT